MYLCAEFVHIPAATIVIRPIIFPQLIEKHRITYTFAPYFFLARLVQSIKADDPLSTTPDMSYLRHLILGGESNLMETIATLFELLQRYNLRDEVIRPGFNITKTYTSFIYSKNYFTYNIIEGYLFTSLEKLILDIKI